MKKSLNLSPKTIDEILVFLGSKYNLDPSVVRTITSHPMEFTKHVISKGEAKGVLIHNFGSFETYLVSVNREIIKVIQSHRKGSISRELTNKKVKLLWRLRNECKQYE